MTRRGPCAIKGLIIKTPWIDYLLDGTKTWEIRGRPTTFRGPVALIRSGSGQIVGIADLVDCHALSAAAYAAGQAFHQIPPDVVLPYASLYAWVFAHPRRLAVPRPYRHPRGAIVWVTVPDDGPTV